MKPVGPWLFLLAAFLLFLAHGPYLGLPYFWDELGQFVPAALDLYHDGSLVPHSAVPNAHPPGVMAYLAGVWRMFGYSIPATRSAMLVLASLAAMVTVLLGLELSRARAPALIAGLLLLADPLFYTQAMMAQLDMPAMLLTITALLLFLEDRHVLAVLASTALVLVKETGALLPAVLGVALLFDPPRRKNAVYYLLPFLFLGVWFFILWRATGYLFGDPGFTHYNIGYALNPVRAGFSLARHIFYLGVDDFRWIAALAIVFAWRKSEIYSTRPWKIVWSFLAVHVVTVSVFGGAELERYLLPVLPLLYIAASAALWSLRPMWRNLGIASAAAGLLAGLFLNPPFPFPFEDNLAMVDFVQLHRAAAQFIETNYSGENIYTAWPLTAALRVPAFGFVGRELKATETSDLHYSTLMAIEPQRVHVLILYSRTWEPGWRLLRSDVAHEFLHRFYEYERQMNSAEVRAHFGLEKVQRWSRRGQWIEIYARAARSDSP